MFAGGYKVQRQNTEEHAEKKNQNGKKSAISSSSTGFFCISLSKAFGYQCINTNSRANTNRNHQHLHRKCQRQSIQGSFSIFWHVRNKGTVYDIVHGLQYHRTNHWNAHFQEKLMRWCCPHFVRISWFGVCVCCHKKYRFLSGKKRAG